MADKFNQLLENAAYDPNRRSSQKDSSSNKITKRDATGDGNSTNSVSPIDPVLTQPLFQISPARALNSNVTVPSAQQHRRPSATNQNMDGHDDDDDDDDDVTDDEMTDDETDEYELGDESTVDLAAVDYRPHQQQQHRQQQDQHQYDPDSGKPICKFDAERCPIPNNRKNAQHFVEYAHPNGEAIALAELEDRINDESDNDDDGGDNIAEMMAMTRKTPEDSRQQRQREANVDRLGEQTFVLPWANNNGRKQQQQQQQQQQRGGGGGNSTSATSKSLPICEYDEKGCTRKNPQHFLEYSHPNGDEIARVMRGDFDEDQTPRLGSNKKHAVKFDGGHRSPQRTFEHHQHERSPHHQHPKSPSVRHSASKQQQLSPRAQRLTSGSLDIDEELLLFGVSNKDKQHQQQTTAGATTAASAAAAPAAVKGKLFLDDGDVFDDDSDPFAMKPVAKRNNNNNNNNNNRAAVDHRSGRPIRDFPTGARLWKKKAHRAAMAEKLESTFISLLASDEALFRAFDPFIGKRFGKLIAQRRDALVDSPEDYPIWREIQPLRHHALDEVAVDKMRKNQEQIRKQQKQQQRQSIGDDANDVGGGEADDMYSAAANATISSAVDPLAYSVSSGRTLRPYQITGINVLLRNFSRGIGTIVGDDMGLGKTCQVVVFLAALKERIGLAGPHLIICPLSTLSSWAREMQRFAPDLGPVVVYRGPANHRATLQLPGPRIFLVTPATFTSDRSFFTSVRFGVAVVDEAQMLRGDDTAINKYASHIRACGRVLLSGTPVSNTASELWSLNSVLHPSLGKGLQRPDNDDQDAMHDAAALLRLVMLRRTKAEVLKDIPPKIIHETEHVDPSPVQLHALRACVSKSPEVPDKMLRLFLQQAIKLSNHPLMFTVIAARTRPPRVPPSQWKRNVDFITEQQGFPLTAGLEALLSSGAQLTEREIVNSSAKMMQLDALLSSHISKQAPESAAGGRGVNNDGGMEHVMNRALIFSRFSSMIDILEGYCVLRGFRYERLCGASNQAERELAMARFNHASSRVFVFLITTTAGGVGVTLTGANHVIFYDTSDNPSQDLQAADRAHRIGQTRTVHVHRLALKNSVEEEVIARAKKKLMMAEYVTDRMNHFDPNNRSVESESDDDENASDDDGDDDDASSDNAQTPNSSDDEYDYDVNGDLIVVKKTKTKKKKKKKKKEKVKSGAAKALEAAAARIEETNAATTTTATIKLVLKKMLADQRKTELCNPARRTRRQRLSQTLTQHRGTDGHDGWEGDHEDGQENENGGNNHDNDNEDDDEEQKKFTEVLVARVFEAMRGGKSDEDDSATAASGGGSTMQQQAHEATPLAAGICFGCDESAHPARLLHCIACVKSYHMREECVFGKPLPARAGSNNKWSCPRHRCYECGSVDATAVYFCCTKCPVAYCIDCLPARYLSLEGSTDGFTLPLVSKRYPLMDEEGMVERRSMMYIEACAYCDGTEKHPSSSSDDDDDVMEDGADQQLELGGFGAPKNTNLKQASRHQPQQNDDDDDVFGAFGSF